MTTFTGATDFHPETTASSRLSVRVITPHAGLEGFRNAIQSLWKEFSRARNLAWRFFLRDLQAEHRQSVLGYGWLILPALANTLVWVFLNDQDLVHIDSGGVPYPLFVLTSTVLWTAFTATLTGMLGVLQTARGVLAKVNFPQEALIYSAFMRAAVDAVTTSLLVIPALFLFHPSIRPAMLLFPLAVLGSLLLGSALGLLILPLAALYSDVGRLVQLMLRFGFFLTPVIFMLPTGGIARRVMLLNPATPIIVSGRAWLTNSGEALPAFFIGVATSCILLTWLGLVIYKIALPHLIERIGG